MFDLLKQLTTAYGPAGRETGIAEVLETLCAPFAQCSRDAMGNLIAHKPGPGKRIMIAAHMDSLGLVATYTEEGNFIRVAPLGGINPANILGQRVRFGSGVTGVFRADDGVSVKELSFDKCYIDTCGVAVKLGDVAIFEGDPIQIGDAIVSQYLDNRSGCAVGVKLLELAQDCDADLYVVFTTQEEVGCRGAGGRGLRHSARTGGGHRRDSVHRRPRRHAEDYPPWAKARSSKSSTAAASPAPMISKLLADSAAALNIPVQYQAATAGGTDAGMISTSRCGVPTGNLAIATRGTHTPNETCSLSDVAQCAALLRELVSRA